MVRSLKDDFLPKENTLKVSCWYLYEKSVRNGGSWKGYLENDEDSWSETWRTGSSLTTWTTLVDPKFCIIIFIFGWDIKICCYLQKMLQTYRQTDIRHHISLVNFVLKTFIIVKTLGKMVFKSIFYCFGIIWVEYDYCYLVFR